MILKLHITNNTCIKSWTYRQSKNKYYFGFPTKYFLLIYPNVLTRKRYFL